MNRLHILAVLLPVSTLLLVGCGGSKSKVKSKTSRKDKAKTRSQAKGTVDRRSRTRHKTRVKTQDKTQATKTNNTKAPQAEAKEWKRDDTPEPPPPDGRPRTYIDLPENPFVSASKEPVSTFSIDVDTASYANVRSYLMMRKRMPPPAAVRIEELVNYFEYDYAPPTGEHPFAVHAEVASCPWKEGHRLVRIALKGKVIERDERPACNLVFLLDVSGSMNAYNKLPMLKKALGMLLDQLQPGDRVAIVVYAGASGLVLPSTPASKKAVIMGAMNKLRSGGSTNAGAGIQLAYAIAGDNFFENGINRVVLATDGDFNIGKVRDKELHELITKQAKSGIFLTVLGFGLGHQDSTMELLADKGNGNYAYIDTLKEAKKVLVDQVSGTLVTIAKDVKIQVEFDAQRVKSYRLIGYENRMLAKEDFEDDTKDAGEIGAGHTVTALYQVEPKATGPGKLLTLKLRYKLPKATDSRPMQTEVQDGGRSFGDASQDFRFASSVAAFGMLLRGSRHRGTASYPEVAQLAKASKGVDKSGFREEFLELVRRAHMFGGER